MNAVFATPPENRFFEDYEVGATYHLGSFTVSEDEIVAFATIYDPQAMHVDKTLAKAGPFGGVIASGWQTMSLTMRLIADNFLPHNGLPSPGIDELRWPAPVRPGDTLSVRASVQQARRSRTKPDRGMLTTLIETVNQSGDVVLSLRPMNLVRCRILEAVPQS
ncbi:MaoC family dehydratase [Rhodopila sp.]|jgi:acyl dehydratase|uniref:MaoC family dehydratase n=1 Tax=Rhodopila sp. TaxID=2480087 RepID=UPI002BADC95E|nr:MaoC family dehydratase [Rhodopila sp.]HVZ09550.1 MaoC family dehydratase [Rhodopila sp.]